MSITHIQMTYKGQQLTFPVFDSKIYVPIADVCQVLKLTPSYHIDWLESVSYFSKKMIRIPTKPEDTHSRKECLRDIDALAWLCRVANITSCDLGAYHFMDWLRDHVEAIYQMQHVLVSPKHLKLGSAP